MVASLAVCCSCLGRTYCYLKVDTLRTTLEKEDVTVSPLTIPTDGRGWVYSQICCVASLTTPNGDATVSWITPLQTTVMSCNLIHLHVPRNGESQIKNLRVNVKSRLGFRSSLCSQSTPRSNILHEIDLTVHFMM